MSKKKIKLGAIVTMLILIVLFCLYYVGEVRNDGMVYELGYYPIDEVLQEGGYEKKDSNVYEKTIANKIIRIEIDLERERCNKNEYLFDIAGAIYQNKNISYMRKEKLESILNCILDYENGKIVWEEDKVVPHEWVNENKLIAHSGGGVREDIGVNFYTNSLEAIVQNYNLGHRVFEIDFGLTSDNNLAAIHDWIQFANKDGNPVTADEWKKFKIDNGAGGYYTPLLIGDILDEMLVNKDMYIVTDTKSYELTKEEIEIQFQLIYDEAMKRDPNLINRVIPQMYNQEMYDVLMSIYNFPSIIYTVYASPDTPEQIEEFAKIHENVKVIVCPVDYWGFDEAMIKKMHTDGLLLYVHTIQTFDQMQLGINKGYDGFYTGLLTPNDYENYIIISNK